MQKLQQKQCGPR